MAQMEHLMNVYASKAAKGSIAEFLGYCEVAAEESNYRLTEGLWLVSSSSQRQRQRQQQEKPAVSRACSPLGCAKQGLLAAGLA
jgi:hypothetical protein